MRSLLVGLLLVAGFQTQLALALSPPWYEFALRVKTILGADKCVVVGDLIEPNDSDSPFIVPVQVCNHSKAVALSQIVGGPKELAGISIQVRISDAQGVVTPVDDSTLNIDQAASLIQKALTGNALFSKIIKATNAPILWVEFKISVIQYTADNIANYYGQNNEIAEEAFAQVLDFSGMASVAIRTTTAKR